MSRRSAMQSKRTELERKIKDLGSLPSEAFEKYRDHGLQELHKLLQKANTQLKKFRYSFCCLATCLSCLLNIVQPLASVWFKGKACRGNRLHAAR